MHDPQLILVSKQSAYSWHSQKHCGKLLLLKFSICNRWNCMHTRPCGRI